MEKGEFWQKTITAVEADDVESLVELGLSKAEKLEILSMACEKGSVKTVKVLLSQIDLKDVQENLLAIAAENKKNCVIKELCSGIQWKKSAIDTAYKLALNNRFFDVVNNLFFYTGQMWSTPIR